MSVTHGTHFHVTLLADLQEIKRTKIYLFYNVQCNWDVIITIITINNLDLGHTCWHCADLGFV